MNKVRRQQIDKVLRKLAELREEIEIICDDEQNAYDNLPEGIQESDRGETMYEAIENLEYARDTFDEIEEYLESAKGDY